MKKLSKKIILIFCALALVIPSLVFADGMIIPPENYYVHETDQKAVIFYDKGIETLVLSITFKGNADDFGWIVPTPAKPEVSKGSDDIFTNLERLTGTTNRYYDELPAFGLGVGSTKQVTIIETKKIDYYDMTVLTATDRDALANWLKQNNYNFPSSASYILDSYIDNGWYFVAMKINPKSLEWKDVSQQLREGHATPVVLKFKTDKIVYPLKISSVTSRDSDYSEIGEPIIDETFSSPTYSSGRIGKGISINSNDIFTLGADSAFSTEEGSVEVWLKPGDDWASNRAGYCQIVDVINNLNQNIYELRRGNDGVYESLQFGLYTPSYNVWNTTAQSQLKWDSSQWYYIVATWSKDNSPQIYINGVLQTLYISHSGTSRDIPAAKGQKIYIGQRSINLGTDAAQAVFDELRISSKAKTADEIKTAYNQVLGNKQLELESNTLFLAHFDSNLKEEKSGKTLDYEDRSLANPTTVSDVSTKFKPNLTVTYIDENKITRTSSFSPAADATIATNYGNNYGKTGFCSVGNTSNKDTHACLLKFDLSSIPSSATISKASLSLYQYDGGSGNLNTFILRVLKDWKEGSGTSSSGNPNSSADGVTANERYYGASWSKQFIGADDTDASSRFYSTLTLDNNQGIHTWEIDTALIDGWVKGTYPNYGLVIKALSSSANSPHALYSKDYTGTGSEIKRNVTYPTSASILLYIIAGHKKELTGFSTSYAHWIDKKNIQKLATDDQGNALINPPGKKYFLTKLSRTMRFSDMTADLFPQDASNNETIGQPIPSGGTDSATTFYIFIALAIVITFFLIIIIFVVGQKKPNNDQDNKVILK